MHSSLVFLGDLTLPFPLSLSKKPFPTSNQIKSGYKWIQQTQVLIECLAETIAHTSLSGEDIVCIQILRIDEREVSLWISQQILEDNMSELRMATTVALAISMLPLNEWDPIDARRAKTFSATSPRRSSTCHL